VAERHTRGDGDFRRLVAHGEARTGMPAWKAYDITRANETARDEQIAEQLAAIRLEARRRVSARMRNRAAGGDADA